MKIFIINMIANNNCVQTGKIGITKFAQGELGDIVHVDIKEVGHQFSKGEGIVSKF